MSVGAAFIIENGEPLNLERSEDYRQEDIHVPPIGNPVSSKERQDM